MVDRDKREVVIMSEAVNPDFLPEEKGVHRVNEYWSTMVIRAKGDMDQVWDDDWLFDVCSSYFLSVWCVSVWCFDYKCEISCVHPDFGAVIGSVPSFPS